MLPLVNCTLEYEPEGELGGEKRGRVSPFSKDREGEIFEKFSLPSARLLARHD